ncbi:hypothetical protein DMH01_03245 [Amycolatopsis sp. WAC 04182]|uniref:hypothetical protein n=1 Tax=Amycolatopsis sp. WAC 04182 TaxID=2203198 RepID=UPI000F78FE3E|nr:hypothetical protein [Amycolatopsis sp. WAC 04182]RSN65406.1 hypothetical protein DMH01_03245 [Amycolatopsis sp. WAC 04182]
MATRLADASQQAACDAVVDRIDVGGAGTLKIYTGSQPADADTTPAGTLLVTIALAATAFGAATSAGTASLASTPRSGTGVAAGTAGCFVVESGGGAKVFGGSVTATGGGGDLTLDNTSIAVGQTVNVGTLTFTHPGT